MNALAQAPVVPSTDTPVTPVLRTLLLCDLADSTALVEQLGDQRSAELFRRHDRLARALLQTHGGREIDKTDGFLLIFDRPVQAVAFALDYLRSLRQLGEDEGIRLAARVGIHVGDVLIWGNAPDDIANGAKQVEVEGLVKPVTSRLMQLALPNQILLSGVAWSLAHRAQGHLGTQLRTVRWRTHGRYRFKGIPDPVPVFEVGEEGLAPLRAPPRSGKAHREVPFWRRPATLGIEILLLLAVIAVPARYMLRPEPAIAFANRDWVVVGDLKNLTSELAFDDSIETAFRIGLEQSRYVNVLSDLKARETVRQMQRDPQETRVDRGIGSEIALRDGARALILPTIAEIGGRVRITAEVVDPQTQATVWSESADGVGASSVLGSLDKVNARLRVRLGEALATVSRESQPLESVTTRSLDALRAYTIGEQTYAKGEMDEALALYRQALSIDPGFALAHVALARIAINADHADEARRELIAARADESRLTPRDKLYAEAMQATLDDPRLALEKLHLLTTLYPSRYEGVYGYFAWQSANRFEDAIAALQASITQQNPYRGTSEYILGVLYLGMERYDDALRSFADARTSGFASGNEFHALAAAALHRHSEADALLAAGRSAGSGDRSLGVDITGLALRIDRGDWRGARQMVTTARSQDAGLDADSRRLLQGIARSTQGLLGPAQADTVPAEAAAVAPAGAVEQRFALLWKAWLQARDGNAAAAQAQFDAAGTASGDGGWPMLAKLRVVAAAELARAGGHPQEAIASLRAAVDGSELMLAHVSLMEAYAEVGDLQAALDQARWLSGHRGRAFAEYNFRRTMTPANIAASTLAHLRAAELLTAMGRKEAATTALAEFRKAWPSAGEVPSLRGRIARLAAAPTASPGSQG
jgi:putative peptide modification system cyclase